MSEWYGLVQYGAGLGSFPVSLSVGNASGVVLAGLVV